MLNTLLLLLIYAAGAEYTRRFSPTYKEHGWYLELCTWPLYLLADAARPQPLKE